MATAVWMNEAMFSGSVSVTRNIRLTIYRYRHLINQITVAAGTRYAVPSIAYTAVYL
ncbi:MAG: hypothetical protein HGJ94_14910 [Desulfosarcina sp.]|nr:hypothetical protein [Desulfosarcina sp.]MBC2741862.1 hypothetical protein [Desulfosarcina sp.]MBC2764775.1 hypothetical protein [Desulfosarcina sp.]